MRYKIFCCSSACKWLWLLANFKSTQLFEPLHPFRFYELINHTSATASTS